MNIKQKYWLLSLGFIGFTLAFLAGMVVYAWLKLAPEVRAQIFQSTDQMMGFFFLGGMLLLIILLFFLNEMFQTYILPLDRLTEESSVVTAVDSSHKVKVQGCREIMQLADRMNEAAGQIQQMQQQASEGGHLDRTALDLENAYLAEALFRLPQGIILCNPWNQIVSFNPGAREICSRILESWASDEYIISYLGMGRSVYDLFPGEQLDKALQTAFSSGFDPHSPPEFSVEGASLQGGKALICVFPLGRAEEENKGYAIQLEECGGAQAVMCSDPEPVSAQATEKRGFVDDSYAGLDTGVKERPGPGRMDSDLLLRPAPVPPLDEVPLDRLPCTVFDLETTGLDPDGGDEIVSLSAVRLLNNRFLDEEPFHQLIDPGRGIPREASRIHGINGEMVKGKPSAKQVLAAFRFYSRNSALVSHCAEFDMLFLHKKGAETEVHLENPVLDTLLLAALVLSSSKDLSLDATAERLEATTYSRHSSLGDALTAAEIYIKLVPMLANEGIRTLSQARQVCRRMRKCVDYSRNPRRCNLQPS